MVFSRFLILWVIFLSIFSLKSQDLSFEEKEMATKEIFNQLLPFYKKNNRPPVTFTLTKTAYHVASTNFETNRISLDEKAYDLCKKVFKNNKNDAIAFLLAHELSHYYEHFEEGKNEYYVNTKKGFSAEKMIKKMVTHEAEADEMGGFLAYLAGFYTIGVGEKLLEEVYKNYDLPEKIEGYPDLSERKKIVRNVENNLKDKIAVFDAANLMLITQNYNAASHFYQHLLENTYPLPEFYNNAAVAKILEALSYFEKDEFPYVLPFEIDAKTRLSWGFKVPEMGWREKIIYREKLIKEAQYLLKNGIENQQFKSKKPLSFNLLLSYLLLENEAFFPLLQQLKIESFDAEKLAMAEAIFWNKKGDEKQTNNILKTVDLSKKNTPFYSQNLQIIQNGTCDWQSNPQIMGFVSPTFNETINGNKIGGIIQLMSESYDKNKTININDIYCLHHRKINNSNAIWVQNKASDEHFIFYSTPHHYTKKTTQNIKIGDSITKIEQNYGLASHILNTSNGRFLVFDNQHIIFYLDDVGEVKRWWIFGVE